MNDIIIQQRALLRVICVAIVTMATRGACAHPQPAESVEPLTFTVTYDPAIAESFTGRVYVMFSTGRQEPRHGPAWFNTQPFFAVDVEQWTPDQPLRVDDTAIGFPGKLSELKEREYNVQAVMRINRDSPEIGSGAGSAYSAVVRQTINGQRSGTIKLHIDQIVNQRPFEETARIKLVELRSPLLSEFHGRDIMMRAAVILPANYEIDAQRRYPTLYWIGGFGSDHRAARFMQNVWSQTGFDDQIARVVLDPLCYGGHHVFADSANNGPRGTALVTEFIPHLERTFRLASSPHARFLSGHSSGGWSSLWLQITYPDFFGGVWSIAPDPVDFTDFQRINLYQPGTNMFIDEDGQRRPIARAGDQVLAWYDEFARMEVVYGEGGQLRSFEWVFSPKGDDGLPKPLYDRHSGLVDAQIAEAWKRYDIRHVLEENWETLGSKLVGKLHVFMGEQDTFLLEGAARRLKHTLDNLGSDAVIEIQPGEDHGSIASPELRQRIDREIAEAFANGSLRD